MRRPVPAWRRAGVALAAAAAMAGAVAAPPAPIDGAADLDALLAGLATHYANFEDTIVARRADLPGLAARARAALAAATSDDDRRRALDRLVRGLRDPHLRIDWSAAAEGEGGGGPGPVCSPDYAAQAAGGGVAFDRIAGFTPLASEPGRLYRAGLLRQRGSPPLGILRIGLFIETAYAPVCAEAARALGKAPEDPCDDACVPARDRAAVQGHVARLTQVVRELERAGARRLVVDITDNGGGSDWSEVVARMLGGPLASARVAMLKHPAWQQEIARRRDELLALRERPTLHSGPARRRLDAALALLDRAAAALADRCDLSAAWSDPGYASGARPLPCHTLVDGLPFHATGIEAAPPPPGASEPALDAALFSPAGYGPFPSGITRLPLVVLINDETHSSAEQFAALLRDRGRALLAGTVSAGAGCGHYTAAGTAFVLPSSRGRVETPDCVRLRADGRSERRGIEPDRPIPWGPSDSPYLAAEKAARVLRALDAPAPKAPAIR